MEGSWGTRPRLPLTAGSLSLHARASCWHPPERHPEHGLSQGTVVLELKIDLGNCQQLVEIDPMMKTWQNHFDSAWAPFSAVNPSDKGKEENSGPKEDQDRSGHRRKHRLSKGRWIRH